MLNQADRRKGRSGISAQAEHASHLFRVADRLEERDAFDLVDAQFKRVEAAQAREDGLRILKAPKALVGSAETELVPAIQAEDAVPVCRLSMVSTLADPNVIAVDASEHRASLATRAGVLSQAIDAQVTAGAENSIEKMLVHQMAAMHTAGMETLIRLQQHPTCLPPVETARLINAVARCFEVYQSGCLTYVKLKARGTQRVDVRYQQVNVNEGGQAIVTERVKLSRRARKVGSSRREE